MLGGPQCERGGHAEHGDRAQRLQQARARAGEHGARDGRRGGDEDDHEPRRPDDAVRADPRDRRHEQREQRHASGDGAPRPGEGGEPPVVQHGQAGGEDRGGAEEDDDGEAAGAVPQGLGEPPRDAGGDTDQERRGGPDEVAVEQRARRPQPQEAGLEGRHLQRLRGLEDHRSGAEGGHQAYGAHERGRGLAGGEGLAAGEERQPEQDHGREAGGGGELVEVGGDQPDEADADEAATEREQHATDAEAGVVAGAVARGDQSGLVVVDDALGRPVVELGAQPGELAGRDRPGEGGGGLVFMRPA